MSARSCAYHPSSASSPRATKHRQHQVNSVPCSSQVFVNTCVNTCLICLFHDVMCHTIMSDHETFQSSSLIIGNTYPHQGTLGSRPKSFCKVLGMRGARLCSTNCFIDRPITYKSHFTQNVAPPRPNKTTSSHIITHHLKMPTAVASMSLYYPKRIK